jgi:hypothetical protein
VAGELGGQLRHVVERGHRLQQRAPELLEQHLLAALAARRRPIVSRLRRRRRLLAAAAAAAALLALLPFRLLPPAPVVFVVVVVVKHPAQRRQRRRLTLGRLARLTTPLLLHLHRRAGRLARLARRAARRAARRLPLGLLRPGARLVPLLGGLLDEGGDRRLAVPEQFLTHQQRRGQRAHALRRECGRQRRGGLGERVEVGIGDGEAEAACQVDGAARAARLLHLVKVRVRGRVGVRVSGGGGGRVRVIIHLRLGALDHMRRDEARGERRPLRLPLAHVRARVLDLVRFRVSGY